MAQVIKNADDTFAVTLTAKEQKTLKRWSDIVRDGSGVSKAKQLELVVTAQLQAKTDEFRQQDGPTMRAQYDALTPEKQAEVDVILATATPAP